MDDQDSVSTEVTPHDQEQPMNLFDQMHAADDDPTESHDEVEESKQDKNWKELRLKAEAAEKAADEERRRARQFEEQVRLQNELLKSVLQQPQAQPQEVDEFEDLPEDEYLSYGKSRKAWERDAKKIAREQYEALEREREKLRWKERIKSEYADFDQVVNQETIALLEKQDPKLAEIIAKNGDPYEMGLLAYHNIRAKGLAKSDEPESIQSREVSKKLEKSEKTVQSPAAYNKRPIAAAFSTQYLSKEQKDQLYQEMMGHAARSGGY